MNKERGKFVVVEGNDGAGKTTMVARLEEYLRSLGFDVVATKEPGGIKETEGLRALILDPRLAEDGNAQLLLFCADRRVHLLREVIPSIKKGCLVICDRFSGSTFVYQHYDRKVPISTVDFIDRFARQQLSGRGEISPDLVILLDVAPEVAAVRQQGRTEKTYFDQDGLARQRIRRSAYIGLARENRWAVVNANQSEEEVFREILTVLEKHDILPKGKK